MTTCGDCKHIGDCFMDGWEIGDNTPSCDGFEAIKRVTFVDEENFDRLSEESKLLVNELIRREGDKK